MTTACNFIFLGEEMRELLDKNWRRKKKKEKRKITDHMIAQKGREICALCRSIMSFGEAEWAVQSFNRPTGCEWRSTIFGKFLQ